MSKGLGALVFVAGCAGLTLWGAKVHAVSMENEITAEAEAVTAAYEAAGIAAEIAPFFQDIPRRMSEAQLVISRAGASSIADLTVIGRPAILIPYPHAAGDHQSANARGPVAAGAAVMIPESALDVATLSAQIAQILTDPDAALQMSRAAEAAGVPDATDRLVTLVESLARKEQP